MTGRLFLILLVDRSSTSSLTWRQSPKTIQRFDLIISWVWTQIPNEVRRRKSNNHKWFNSFPEINEVFLSHTHKENVLLHLLKINCSRLSHTTLAVNSEVCVGATQEQSSCWWCSKMQQHLFTNADAYVSGIAILSCEIMQVCTIGLQFAFSNISVIWGNISRKIGSPTIGTDSQHKKVIRNSRKKHVEPAVSLLLDSDWLSL